MKTNRIITVCILSALSFTPLFAQTPLIETVEIPAGSFIMGSLGQGENHDEAPRHEVIISRPFRMGITEVTNAQYEQFRPAHRELRGKKGVSLQDDEAVVYVSYQDALDFCSWLSDKEGKTYRLPTEAEWEYACRAGTLSNYYTGRTLPASFLKEQRVARDFNPVSLQVAQTEPNAFGLYDMHGNVEEWCLDWYGPYTAETKTDPVGAAEGEFRITRGGSHHTPVSYLRSANRMAMIPEDKHAQTGFRVVQSDYPLPQAGTDLSKPFFSEPVPFVIAPLAGSGMPFYRHNHQPSVVVCDNGDLLAAWFSANEENGRGMVVLSSRMPKGTDSWQPASLFYKVPDRNMTGTSLFNDGKGKLYHFNGVEASGDWQNLMMIMRTSTDNGLSWSASRIIAPEHDKRHQVISGTSQTPEGWIIQPCDAGPGSHDGAAIHISRDNGETWEDPWDGAPMPDFKAGESGSTIAGIHAGVVSLNDGRLLALGRGNSLQNKAGQLRMPMSISHDMGKSWQYEASEFPPVDGGQRLVLMRLNEGPLLLVAFTDHPERTPEADRGMDFERADGTTYKGYGMYAALSYDEGKTWPVRRLLTDGKARLLEGGAWTGNFVMNETEAEPMGYLAGTQAPDGTIHLVSSRMHYRFNLPWLEQKPETENK